MKRSNERASPTDARPPERPTHPNASAFPGGMSGPALRALANAGITSLDVLARWSHTELVALHGMGPKGVRLLEDALAQRSRRLRP